MKNFSELGIIPKPTGFDGDKISEESILGKKIIVKDFRVATSKWANKETGEYGPCVWMQVEVNAEPRVFFKASSNLQSALEQAKEKNELPFATIIKKEGKKLSFT